MIQQIKNHIKNRNNFIDIRRINLNVESYKPKVNKFKQCALFGFVGLCLITPMTNWLLIPTTKILRAFPLWLYR